MPVAHDHEPRLALLLLAFALVLDASAFARLEAFAQGELAKRIGGPQASA